MQEGGAWVIAGSSCPNCGYAVGTAAPWCPRCQSDVEPQGFGPRGTVWSSTVFRVPLQGRTPPWVLAFVDLDEGPRILAHVDGPAETVPVGAAVELVGRSEHGDPLVRVIEEGSRA